MCLKRLAISVLLLIGLPVLGILGGCAARELWYKADENGWASLGRPADTPVAFVDGDSHFVCIQDQDGFLQECDLDRPTRWNLCWRRVDRPRYRDPFATHLDFYSSQNSPPSGEVAEYLHVQWTSFQSFYYASYAILDDGTVSKWTCDGDSSRDLLLQACGAIWGLAGAILIIVVTLLVAGVRALRRKSHQGIRAD
jgi:hypothetical protein